MSAAEGAERAVERCASHAARGRLALFCGAGVSYPSGLPIVRDLLDVIFEQLRIDREDGTGIMNARVPFESLVESFMAVSPIDRLLSTFATGEPNRNHRVFAQLVQRGLLRTICTTNFDLLFERAFAGEGLSAEQYTVLRRETDFAALDPGGSSPLLLKVHGSVDDRASIVVTMRQVAARLLTSSRQNVIDYVFRDGDHDAVLVLGYSCSDVFDLTPQIASVAPSAKQVLFVQHTSGDGFAEEEVGAEQDRNPFKSYSGMRMFCDTSTFIAAFARRLGLSGASRAPVLPDWQQHVIAWASGMSAIEKHLVAASALRLGGRYEQAYARLQTALSLSSDTPYQGFRTRALARLGTICRAIGKRDEARQAFEAAVVLARQTGDSLTEANALADLGTVQRGIGDLRGALESQLAALAPANRSGDSVAVNNVLANLGTTYFSLGRYKEAAHHNDRAVALARQIGNVRTEGTALLTAGAILFRGGRLAAASEAFERARAIAENAGDRRSIAVALANLASCSVAAGKLREAEVQGLEAQRVAADAGIREIQDEVLALLAGIYCEREEPEVARTFALTALEQATETKAWRARAEALSVLAEIYRQTGSGDAVRAQSDALELADRAGDAAAVTRYAVRLAALKIALGSHDHGFEIGMKALGRADDATSLRDSIRWLFLLPREHRGILASGVVSRRNESDPRQGST